MDEAEMNHLKELRAKYVKNLHILELQKANYDVNVPLSIVNGIDEIEKQLDEIDDKLITYSYRHTSMIHVQPSIRSHSSSLLPIVFILIVITSIAIILVVSLQYDDRSYAPRTIPKPTATLPLMVVQPSPSVVSIRRYFIQDVQRGYDNTSQSNSINSSITGRVVDRNKNGISGASIYLNNGYRTLETYKTDQNGVFIVEGLEGGYWSVVLNDIPSSFGVLAEGQVIGVVYVSGSPDQQAVINFIEQAASYNQNNHR